jgi:hypothetical protein
MKGSDQQASCFLCSPANDLAIADRANFRLIAGLGPIVDNYHIIASHFHTRSMADLATEDPRAIDELVALRTEIEATVGPSLVTEHGRVPVCRDDGDDHELHCHHAHMLVFPGAPGIDAIVSRYYSSSAAFSALHQALYHAANLEAYLLVSPTPSSFIVYSDPLNAPRQLARTAVAYTLNEFNKADWRARPDRGEAARIGRRLRNILGGPDARI